MTTQADHDRARKFCLAWLSDVYDPAQHPEWRNLARAYLQLPRLNAAAPELLRACELLEAAEDFNANECRDCEGEGVPELCGTCFPRYDDARLARRAAIAKAQGLPIYETPDVAVEPRAAQA